MFIERVKKSVSFRYKSFMYRYLTADALRPRFEQVDLKAQGYFSQCGQDKWLLENVFKGKQSGVFVDIGAHDGISFSNTFLMERLGWTGIAIEPMPEAFAKLEVNRNCAVEHCCISDRTGSANFRLIKGYAQMLSGLVEEYDQRHLERIDRELQQHGGSYHDIVVPCRRLDDLAEKYGLTEIDYLNLDVEGAELKLLNSIDFEAIYIKVIGVENNYHDYRIPQLLRKNGFKLHSILGDEMYINQKFIPELARVTNQ